jgi:uncharacterized membrane protein
MNDPNSAKSTAWLDGAAVLLSALCLVHCLLLPFIVAGLPLLAQFYDGHLHAQMLVVVVPLSVVALGIGFRGHRNRHIVASGATGLLILIVGATIAHEYMGIFADRLLTIAGALVLAMAHYQNSILARRHRRAAING